MIIYKRIWEIWNNKIVRFVFAGGINALVGYGIFGVLLFFHMNPIIAIILSTILGVVFNFFSSGFIVFNNLNPRNILKFISTYLLVMVLNIALFSIINSFVINKMITQAICLPILASMAYTLQRKFVF